MRRRSLVALLSLAVVQTAAGAIQITQSYTTDAISSGQTATITFSISGTTEPVRLRLRNTSPAFGSLEGGDMQLVTTSGGSPNQVSRRIMGLSPGVVQVRAEPETRNDAAIAEIFRSVMLRIAAQIDRAAKELHAERTGLSQQKTVQLEAVVAILEKAKADMRRSLPYRELIPFHDAVATRIETYRRAITRSATMTEIFNDDVKIALVQTQSELRVNEEEATETLANLADWFRRLGDSSPLARVCFRRAPTDNAMIAVSPKSVPEDRDTTAFVSPLTLYLGEYQYEVTRAGRVTNRGQMDILLNPERVLDCPNANGPSCRLITGQTENCR